LPIMAFDGTFIVMSPLQGIKPLSVIIFVLTIWNVWVGRGEHIRRGSLVAMMWRDGAIYFVLIFASELACVVISATWGFSKTMVIKFLVWTIQNVVIAHSVSPLLFKNPLNLTPCSDSQSRGGCSQTGCGDGSDLLHKSFQSRLERTSQPEHKQALEGWAPGIDHRVQ
jgi:hypothetical protein